MSCFIGGVNALVFFTRYYVFCNPYASRQAIKPPASRRIEASEGQMLAKTEAAIQVIDVKRTWTEQQAQHERLEAWRAFSNAKAIESKVPTEAVRLRKVATEHMRRAKQHEVQLRTYTALKNKLYSTGDTVSMQALNQDIGLIMGDVFDALQQMKKQAGVDVTKVEQITDQLQEQVDSVQEMSSVLARPFEETPQEEFSEDDDAALLAELEALGSTPPTVYSNPVALPEDPLKTLVLANGGRMLPASSVLNPSTGMPYTAASTSSVAAPLAWPAQHARYAPPGTNVTGLQNPYASSRLAATQ